jgi:hypothetical protein
VADKSLSSSILSLKLPLGIFPFRAGYGKGKKFWYTYDPKVHRGQALPEREKKLFANKQIHCGRHSVELWSRKHKNAERFDHDSGVRRSY